MTSQWAWWRLKSPAYRLISQPFVQVQINENIKILRHWPLWGEFTGDRWISRTKGQLRGKSFHLMTPSCRETLETLEHTKRHAIILNIDIISYQSTVIQNVGDIGAPKVVWHYQHFRNTGAHRTVCHCKKINNIGARQSTLPSTKSQWRWSMPKSMLLWNLRRHLHTQTSDRLLSRYQTYGWRPNNMTSAGHEEY